MIIIGHKHNLLQNIKNSRHFSRAYRSIVGAPLEETARNAKAFMKIDFNEILPNVQNGQFRLYREQIYPGTLAPIFDFT